MIKAIIEIFPRIAFFAHYSGLYGANLSLLTLIDSVIDRGFPCVLVVPFKGEFTEILAERGVKVIESKFELCSHALGMDNYWAIQASRPYSLAWIKQATLISLRNRQKVNELVRILKASQINLVHTNSSWISIGAKVAKKLGIPHIWHLREFGELDYSAYPDFGRRYQRRQIEKAGVNICISRAIQKYYNFEGRSKENSRLIYNGVEVRAKIDKRLLDYRVSRMPIRESKLSFASIGLLHRCKGHDLVIRAFASLIKYGFPAKLVIAGDGPHESELRKLVADYSLQKEVVFVGRISNISSLYDVTDVVVVASQSEAMGRVAAEAMAHGVPVIGRDSGATPELITEGITGFTFDGTVDDLREKMLFLFKNDQHRMEMGEASLHIARMRFTIEEYTESMCEIFADMAAS